MNYSLCPQEFLKQTQKPPLYCKSSYNMSRILPFLVAIYTRVSHDTEVLQSDRDFVSSPYRVWGEPLEILVHLLFKGSLS